MNKSEIQKIFYQEKNYSKIKELLKGCSDSWSFNMLGNIAIFEKEPEIAFEYFNKNSNLYGCAYSKFLSGEMDEAKILAALVRNSSPAADWLLALISVIQNEYGVEPTYFQIRNFYEQDLEMLFLYNQCKIAEEIIKKNTFLENFNKEIYKYSARVLFNNKYYEQAKLLLKRSLDIFYKDPETHFILGEIYEISGEIEKAKNSYQKAVNANGEYAPANQKLKRLSN